VIALAANVAEQADLLSIFVLYFACTGFVMLLMFFRIRFLKILLYLSKRVTTACGWEHTCAGSLKRLSEQVKHMSTRSLVFFAKKDALATLNKAVLYVRENEDSSWIRMVHVYDDKTKIPPKLIDNVRLLDCMYPKMRMDVVFVQGQFGPLIIEQLSQHLGISKNRMFIACPNEESPHNVSKLGGVRVITH
jgi:hypothetical protein